MTYGPQGDPVSIPQEAPKTQPAGVPPALAERSAPESRLLSDTAAENTPEPEGDAPVAAPQDGRDYAAIVKRCESLVPAWENVLANTMMKGEYEKGQKNDLATRIDELRSALGI